MATATRANLGQPNTRQAHIHLTGWDGGDYTVGILDRVLRVESELVSFIQDLKDYTVFISYHAKDTNLAKRIEKHAKAAGIETWMYQDNTELGTPIRKKIQRKIDQADALVVLLTEHSEHSTYVQQEIGYAEGTGTDVLPLMHRSFDKDNLGMLTDREWIKFTDEEVQYAAIRLKEQLAERFRGDVQSTVRGVVGFGVFLLVLHLWPDDEDSSEEERG